jgi:hypothetical protein
MALKCFVITCNIKFNQNQSSVLELKHADGHRDRHIFHTSVQFMRIVQRRNNNQLTRRRRIPPEKLTVAQLVKHTALYGTGSFVSLFIRFRHYSLT